MTIWAHIHTTSVCARLSGNVLRALALSSRNFFRFIRRSVIHTAHAIQNIRTFRIRSQKINLKNNLHFQVKKYMRGEKEIEFTFGLYRLQYAVVDRHEREFHLPIVVVVIFRGVEIFLCSGKMCVPANQSVNWCVSYFTVFLSMNDFKGIGRWRSGR